MTYKETLKISGLQERSVGGWMSDKAKKFLVLLIIIALVLSMVVTGLLALLK